MRKVMEVLAAAAMLQTGSASAAPLQPTGKWTIDYAKDYCILSRDGGVAEPGVAFRTRPLALRHDLIVYMAKSGKPNGWGNGVLRIGDSGSDSPRMVQTREIKDKAHRYAHVNITNEEFDALSRAGSLQMEFDQEFNVRATLPIMDKAIAALRDCEDDLARRWGLDPSEIRGWSVAARPKKKWDKAALQNGWPDWRIKQSKNRASFRIGPDGRPFDCRVLETSGSTKFDDALCKAVARMRFHPALDTAGRPVPSVSMLGIYWQRIE